MKRSRTLKVATGVATAPFQLLNIMFGTAQGLSLPAVFFGNFLSLFFALGFLWNPTKWNIVLWAKHVAMTEGWEEIVWRGFWVYPEAFSFQAWLVCLIGGACALFAFSHLQTSIRSVGIKGKIVIGVLFLFGYMAMGAGGFIDTSDSSNIQWAVMVITPAATAVALTWTMHKKRRLGTNQAEDADTDSDDHH